MRIQSITLHPFAGISNQTFDFETGMNILLGANEAGKSTIFHAIKHVLLTSTQLTRTQLDKTLGRFFPLPAGDTIRISLNFTNASDQSILLKKTWIKGNRNGSVELQLPDGSILSDDAVVQQKMQELLNNSTATFERILLSSQSNLHESIQELKDQEDLRSELGHILRKQLMQTGGISIDRFRSLLDQKHDQYFKRWDIQADYPQNNRGITSPYRNGTGLLLDAFYAKEALQRDLTEAQQFEDELDAIHQKLNEVGEQKLRIENTLSKIRPLKADIIKRQSIESKLLQSREQLSRIKQIVKEWPSLENQLSQLEEKIKQTEAQKSALSEEFAKAQQKSAYTALKKKLADINELESNLEEERNVFGGLPKIESSDLQVLRDWERQINTSKARLEAGKLRIRMKSPSSKQLRLRVGTQEEKELSLSPDIVVEESADGIFSLMVDDLEIDVSAGEQDLSQVLQELEQITLRFQEKLKALGVESLTDADVALSAYQAQQRRLEQLEKDILKLLGDKSKVELEEELDQMGSLDQVRDLNEIQADLTLKTQEIAQFQSQKDQHEQRISTWQEEFADVDAAMEKTFELGTELKGKEKELEELAQLPEGYESAEALLHQLSEWEDEERDLKDSWSELKLEIAQKEADAPDESSEELQKALELAESDYEKVRREALTLDRVRKKALQTLDALDANTHTKLQVRFLYWLQQMSGDRFKTVALDADMPEHFETQDNKALAFEQLSHGTQDMVALAWRFALSEFFLKDQTGILLFDDPMVDMDANRRKHATEAFKQFSASHQILLMTCHEEHAEGLSQNCEAQIINI